MFKCPGQPKALAPSGTGATGEDELPDRSTPQEQCILLTLRHFSSHGVGLDRQLDSTENALTSQLWPCLSMRLSLETIRALT